MNPDIRIEISFRGHRKRGKLQALLGPGSTDHLLDLWIGSALSRPEGILNGYDPLDIAMEAGWDGDPEEFVNALVKVGFLDILDNGTYALHDWEEHQPFVVKTKEREEHARKASNARWSERKSRTKTAQCILGASSENAQSMLGACSEHAPSNAPIPIPIVSNIQTAEISRSILSALHGAEEPQTAVEPSLPSAPVGAVCTYDLSINGNLSPKEELSSPERCSKKSAARTVDPDEQPASRLGRAPQADAIRSLRQEGSVLSRNAPAEQELPDKHVTRRSSECPPSAKTAHPNTSQLEELKEDATPKPLPPDHRHETAPKVYFSRRKRKLSGWKLKAFEEFWEAFNYRKGKAEASDAWIDIPELTPELARKITAAAGREARARPALISKGQTPKWAQGWITARRWEDWEDDSATAQPWDRAPGQKENGAAKTSPSRQEEESQYRESLREALKRFM